VFDITAAFIQIKITFPERNPFGVLRYIASAVFGKERANSESSMYFFGTLFHFIIAYGFTILFFLIYSRIRFLSKSRVATGILLWIDHLVCDESFSSSPNKNWPSSICVKECSYFRWNFNCEYLYPILLTGAITEEKYN